MIKLLSALGLILSLGTFPLLAQQTEKNLEQATFGAGCFWCVEAVYEIVEGIEKVESGYSGGHVENPSYNEVWDT